MTETTSQSNSNTKLDFFHILTQNETANTIF